MYVIHTITHNQGVHVLILGWFGATLEVIKHSMTIELQLTAEFEVHCNGSYLKCQGSSKIQKIYRTSRDRPKLAPYPRLKNSKKTSKCQVLFYSTRKSKKNFRKNYIVKKIDRVARRGSLARAPGALKSHNAEKLKGGTLWGFSTSILSQNMKKLKKTKIFIFGENLTMPKKTERGDSLGFFNIHSVAKHQRKCRGDPLGKNFFFEKKVSKCRKKMEGGSLWSRPVWYVTRKNRKTFLVQFARPNSAFWCNNIL